MALFLVAGFVSCKKEKPTTADIYVRDQGNNAVAGLRVVLTAQPTEAGKTVGFATESVISDSDGKAEFDFSEYFELGQAGLFVLNVTIDSGAGSLVMGSGVIQIQEEEKNELTVVIN